MGFSSLAIVVVLVVTSLAHWHMAKHHDESVAKGLSERLDIVAKRLDVWATTQMSRANEIAADAVGRRSDPRIERRQRRRLSVVASVCTWPPGAERPGFGKPSILASVAETTHAQMAPNYREIS